MKNVATIFDRVVSIVLTGAVVVFVVAYVQRARAPAQSRLVRPALSFEKRWRELLEAGHQQADVGDRAAGGQQNAAHRVEIIEFVDFECPFCKRFDAVLQVVSNKYRGKVRRTFIHTPIPGHRFAYHAARMSECAADQGRFWPMHDALFARQDSFGLREWSAYARDAGVANLPLFDKCTREATPIAAIERGLQMGKAFQMSETPTVYLNGWRLALPPQDEKVLDDLIEQFLTGKKELEAVGQKFSRAVEIP